MPLKIYCLVGLRRSGNHAITNWIRPMLEPMVHLNDLPVGQLTKQNLESYRSPEGMKSGTIDNKWVKYHPDSTLLLSVEDSLPAAIHQQIQELEASVVVLVRDPWNNMASRYKLDHSQRLLCTLGSKWCDLVSTTPADRLLVYNEWLTSLEYRQMSAKKFFGVVGSSYSDAECRTIRGWGKSYFDPGATEAQPKELETRYQGFASDPLFRTHVLNNERFRMLWASVCPSKPIVPDLARLEPPLSIVAALMVKDEELTVERTIESIAGGEIQTLVLLDTGSTDDTLQLATRACRKAGIRLLVHHGTFVDFATTRNKLLDCCLQTTARYVFILDSNDEVHNLHEGLQEVQRNPNMQGFNIQYALFSGGSRLTTYYTPRIILNDKRWRYSYPVHEVLAWKPGHAATKSCGITLYQDRLLEAGKRSHRLLRDIQWLTKAIEDEKSTHEIKHSDPRLQFYLAQSYLESGQPEQARKYYKLRYRNPRQGFQEERFVSLLRIASTRTGYKKLTYLYQAHREFNRMEPLLQAADVFIETKQWPMAYTLLSLASAFEFPEKALLFSDRSMYDYERWHKLGIVCFYVGKIEEGKRAVENALRAKPSSKIDQQNLMFYLPGSPVTSKTTK